MTSAGLSHRAPQGQYVSPSGHHQVLPDSVTCTLHILWFPNMDHENRLPHDLVVNLIIPFATQSYHSNIWQTCQHSPYSSSMIVFLIEVKGALLPNADRISNWQPSVRTFSCLKPAWRYGFAVSASVMQWFSQMRSQLVKFLYKPCFCCTRNTQSLVPGSTRGQKQTNINSQKSSIKRGL